MKGKPTGGPRALLVLLVCVLSSGCAAAPLLRTVSSGSSPGGAYPATSSYTGNGVPMDPASALQRAADMPTAMSMHTAERVAISYFYEHGTYDGFTPEVAAEYDPTIKWNSLPAAIEGEVSIRGLSALTVVLASKDASGRTWCVGDDRSQDLTYHGLADPATAAECPNDIWPEI